MLQQRLRYLIVSNLERFGRDPNGNHPPLVLSPLRLNGRDIIEAFSAARLVMERSPHSVLVGEVRRVDGL